MKHNYNCRLLYKFIKKFGGLFKNAKNAIEINEFLKDHGLFSFYHRLIF
jgi:hypothetical protein